jgi:VCBS repeat-containing protein
MPPIVRNHESRTAPFPRPGLHRRRRPRVRLHEPPRVVLAAELLEDRTHPSGTDPTALLAPPQDSLTTPALLSPISAAAEPVRSVLSTTGTDPARRLVSFDLAGSDPSADALATGRHELVLIDADVPDRELLARALLASAGPGGTVEVVELAGGGVTEITAVLGREHGLDAVRILSHAAPGGLHVGNDWLTPETLGAYSSDLRAWGSALNPGADILLYGCALAGDAEGRQLVSAVSALTGADVAASTDPTGSAALGGDWALEYATGRIEAAAFAGPAAGWDHLLSNPTANDDHFTTGTNVTLTAAAPGVLGNDDEAGGGPLTAALTQQARSGTVVLNTDGSFAYTPDPGFTGTDEFRYKATNAAGTSNNGHAFVAVTNTAPVANDDHYSTSVNLVVLSLPLSVSAPGVLGNDTDANGDPLTAQRLTGPAHGLLTFNADGSFTYTAVLNFSGTDSFTYRVSDGTAWSAPSTVFINVSTPNQAPITTDDAYTTAEDTPLVVAAPGVLGNDTDPNGNTLTATLGTPPAHGTLSFAADGRFTYTPDPGWHGTDTFTYQADDGTAESNLATVTIVVTPVNDPPVGVTDTYSTTQNTPLTVAGPGVLGNDIDVDGDPLTAVLVGGPGTGRLTFNPDGSFVYTPHPGFTGTVTFTYQAVDPSAATSAPVTVTLKVLPPTNRPVANTDAYAMMQDGVLVVASPGVLGNDTPPGTDPLLATLIGSPTNGTVALNPDGSFTYTPHPGFVGTDSFNYKATDLVNGSTGASQVVITVIRVNHPPASAPDAYTTPAGSALTVPAAGVLANDTDPDGDPLTAALVGPPAHGTVSLFPDGSFVYNPDPGFVGDDTFTYEANDGTTNGGVVAVTITVTPVAPPDQPPAGAPDAYATAAGAALVVPGPGVLQNDTDPDGDPLTAVLATGASHGTVTMSGDGSFTYTPDPGFAGTDSFTYRVSDGRLTSAEVTVTITVNPQLPPLSPPPTPPDPGSVGAPPSLPPLPPPLTSPLSPVPPPVSPLTPPLPPTPTDVTLVPSVPIAGVPIPGVPVIGTPVPGTTGFPTPGTTTPVPTVPGPTVVVLGPAVVGMGPATGTLPIATVLAPAVAVVDTGRIGTTVNTNTATEPGRVFGSHDGAVFDPGPRAVAAGPADARPAIESKSPTVTATPAVPPSEPPRPTTAVTITPPAGPQQGPLSADLPLQTAFETGGVGAETAVSVLQEESGAIAVGEAGVVTVFALAAGYVLLNTRAAYWFLSAVLARPAVWRPFDPLDVIFAWEVKPDEQPAGDESLEELVR